ncbi:sensor histidine kinase [Gordonibacter massiliensis (ex Traore et al. 2017)]|uniref:histidine kinase n=1 Tax=Gordonibacter massiliensis (ex Traore et al. 2017) TaxID=1841863 RepID=A0A842JE80_9ACTN|nr:HAMP domain-containing sensor histidine kinase [Gordonibacter massiliensis (ex Traore et al. 2017)]MBC2890592.1 HAMP domain-containing histidine kinase [Gordonibacter massiliensis (ex Traore et al. 2017)]
MRSLRFWQKAYLLTLALFLAALYGGVAFIGWQNQQQTMASEVEKARGEQSFVAQALAQDLAAVEGGNTRLQKASLARSYGTYYAQNGILLAVSQNGEELFSNLPVGEGGDVALAAEAGRQSWSLRTLDNAPYLLVASALPGGLDDYTLVCGRSMEQLHATWARMRTTLVVSSTIVSVVLAAGLFLVLRRLAKPLESLAGVADEFAAGNYAVRAEKRSDDEVGMLAASLNAMADAAERDIVEIRRVAEQNARMAANLSHEIRTPLTAIRGYAEYLRIAEATDDERESALRYMMEQSERLQGIAQRILQLSSLEHDDVEFEPVELGGVVDQVAGSVRPLAGQRGVKVSVEPFSPVSVPGDAILLESLFTNLVENAVRACEPGGRVDVAIEARGTSVVVRVTDDGRGLAPDELARLGEPFYRPDKARSREAGGAGLGVALSYEIARVHAAELSFASEPGRGTAATVLFTGS